MAIDFNSPKLGLQSGGGLIPRIIQYKEVTTNSHITATNGQDIAAFNVNITPTDSASHILLFAHVFAGADTNAGDIRMGNDVDFDNTSRPMFGEIHFYKKGNVGTSYKPGAYGFFYAENTNGYFGTWHFHGSYEVAVDTNYVQIVPSTGNIAKGEFTLFGVRNT